MSGFHLYRSARGDRATATRITTALIPAVGDGVTGARYRWLDATAQPGVAYTYWLQEQHTSGALTDIGSVQAAASGQSNSDRVYLPSLTR